MYKYILIVLLGIDAMTLQAMPTETGQLSRDEAIVRSHINAFSSLADQGAFEYLGRLLAPKVRVDYRSLFGGEAEVLDRTELMQRWASFLPGFDATFHELSNMHISSTNNKRASVNVDVTASHYLDTGFWAVSGQYEFELERNHGNWKINSIKLIAKSEQGSRDILG